MAALPCDATCCRFWYYGHFALCTCHTVIVAATGRWGDHPVHLVARLFQSLCILEQDMLFMQRVSLLKRAGLVLSGEFLPICLDSSATHRHCISRLYCSYTVSACVCQPPSSLCSCSLVHDVHAPKVLYISISSCHRCHHCVCCVVNSSKRNTCMLCGCACGATSQHPQIAGSSAITHQWHHSC